MPDQWKGFIFMPGWGCHYAHGQIGRAGRISAADLVFVPALVAFHRESGSLKASFSYSYIRYSVLRTCPSRNDGIPHGPHDLLRPIRENDSIMICDPQVL